ncbi:hypothetical protein [uncultured Draconibacterium sp.]|uniref:hypothetical protein n=1 Tax=uncultured Draconibacterium sp. TaxID=1573823 RepID=UPI0029C0A34E|nr:hypothetical protein [uncultured Draconibacterium sp.]
MKRTTKFESYSEKEYPVYMDFQNVKKKERDFRSEEHFVVPWELSHDEKKYTAKSWE